MLTVASGAAAARPEPGTYGVGPTLDAAQQITKSLGLLTRVALAASQGSLIAAPVAAPDLPSAAGATLSTAPEILTAFPGTFSAETSPPNTTVAASPARVVQLTNLNYAITNRATGTTNHGTAPSRIAPE